jgi:hypothetical protein
MENLEFTDGTYAMLWSAILKTEDKNLLRLFKQSIHKITTPVMHYTVEKILLFNFLNNIQKFNIPCDIDKILFNCNKEGYYKKHYSFKK